MPQYIRRTQKAIGTTATTIGGYTVPTGKAATIVGLNICNVLGVSVTANVAIANSSSVSTYLLVNTLIPVGSAQIPVGGDQKIILMSGDSVKVSSNMANSLDVVLSIVETF